MLAAARNIVEGGSLTIIATAGEALGGETTVIALDAALTASGRIPALDLATSATLRAELLVEERRRGDRLGASDRAARLATTAQVPDRSGSAPGELVEAELAGRAGAPRGARRCAPSAR